MKALRKLVLGETWTLPLGVLATLALALSLHAVAGDTAWWRHAGGFVLLACVLAALAASLAPALRRRYARQAARSSWRGGSRREMTFETPLPPIETP